MKVRNENRNSLTNIPVSTLICSKSVEVSKRSSFPFVMKYLMKLHHELFKVTHMDNNLMTEKAIGCIGVSRLTKFLKICIVPVL